MMRNFTAHLKYCNLYGCEEKEERRGEKGARENEREKERESLTTDALTRSVYLFCGQPKRLHQMEFQSMQSGFWTILVVRHWLFTPSPSSLPPPFSSFTPRFCITLKKKSLYNGATQYKYYILNFFFLFHAIKISVFSIGNFFFLTHLSIFPPYYIYKVPPSLPSIKKKKKKKKTKHTYGTAELNVYLTALRENCSDTNRENPPPPPNSHLPHKNTYTLEFF